MLIVRNNRSLDSLDRMFDQLTTSFFATPARTRTSAPNVHADWQDGSLVLTVDLPGIPQEAVSVEIAERGLTVAVDHATDRGELRWSRTMQLGGSLDADAVTAQYADGRLTVTVPPAAKPEPRKVMIAGPAEARPAAIDAASAEATDATEA